MEKIYILIQAGHEGIEKLLYATTKKEDIIKEILRLRNIIIFDKAKMEVVLEKYGKEEDKDYKNEWDRMLDREEIDWDEYQNGKYENPDSLCVQAFDGNEFKCVCTELGVAPSKTWLM